MSWAILAAKRTGSKDVIFGTAEQDMTSSKDLTSTVPVRVILDWANTLEVAVNKMRQQVEERRPFKKVGLECIRKASPQTEEACRFQTLLIMQRDGKVGQPSEDGEEPFAHRDSDHEKTITCPLEIRFEMQSQGMVFNFRFDSKVVDEAQVSRIAFQFEHILRQACDPTAMARTLQHISTLSHQDVADIWRWNSTVPETANTCIHDLIARTAAKQPHAAAICAWDGDLTYGQLDSLSTRLADHLINLGVTEGSIVPLCFEKSMYTPLAMLAVMKAGAASLAMDVSQPKERLCSIIEQVNPGIILSSVAGEELAKTLYCRASVVVVGREFLSHLTSTKASRPLPTTSSASILYVVFTSGSTGTPKGVVVTHRNISSAIKHQQHILGFTPNSRVFDFTSYAFDMAWFNFIHAMYNGSCLCIASDEERVNDPAGCIQRYQVTYALFTPTLARIIGKATLSNLDVLALAGEPVLPSDFNLCQDGKMIVVYGPAECTPGSTIAVALPDNVSAGATIGNGYGVNTWLVDPDCEDTLVSIGEVGELWLEGPLLGQGYLNDSEKTDKAFIQDPSWLRSGTLRHQEQPGRRFYKTGDLARYNPDGSLLFVGRKDMQVKIRGQRVELSEVEHHMRSALQRQDETHSLISSQVQALAEVIKTNNSRNLTLVAFVCVTNGNMNDKEPQDKVLDLAVTTIEQYLVDRVPTYMVPATFIPLDTFPTTATGKTDRLKLRELGASMYDNYTSIQKAQHKHVSTSTDLQRLLVEVWAEVLNVPCDKISIDIPFLSLGGDSIAAMQVVSRCRARDISITVGDVLRSKTIENLAGRSKPMAVMHTHIAAEESLDGQAWSLSPIQQLFFDAHPHGLNHFNQSFVLRLNTPVPGAAVRAALVAVVRCHPMLRARFRQRDDGRWEQVISDPAAELLVFKHHSEVERTEVTKLVKARKESLDILNGPVFAADLFSVTGEDQSLLLTAHHLVVDLVSWRIIWQNIEQHIQTGTVPSHESLSFHRWCRMQRERSSSLSPRQVLPVPASTSEFSYWGVPVVENVERDSQNHVVSLGKATTALILGKSNECFASETVDLLLAALVYSLRQTFPDRQSPPVFIEGHGREALDDFEADLSETVGWFTTLHPVQIPGTCEDGILDTVKFTKDARGFVPNKGLSYFSCRYQSDAGQQAFSNHDEAEIAFNYMGRYQQLENENSLFKLESRTNMNSDNSDVSPKARRLALIEVNAGVEDDKMVTSIAIHKRIRHQNRLADWIRLFEETLNTAAYDLCKETRAFTLIDFPLLKTTYRGLDLLLNEQLLALGITTENVQDIYPCTPVQEGMLLTRNKAAASYANYWVWDCCLGNSNSSNAVTFPQRLEAAWREVVAQHPIFSTVFVEDVDNGGFIQVVLRNSPARVTHLHPKLASESAAKTLLEIERPHFSSGEPECQLTISQGADEDFACRVDISHTLIDATSMQLLLQDLNTALSGHNALAAPPFRDLVQHLSGVSKAERLSFWSAYLTDIEPCELPVLGPSGKQNDQLRGRSYGSLKLPAQASAGIAALCRHHGITRSVFLQIVWALVLSQCTGKQEVCFAYMASGRDAPIIGIERMVGPLINMLISRVDVRKPLGDMLRKAAEDTIEHLKFQHNSLAEIQHRLQLGTRQLFNTALTVHDSSSGNGQTDTVIFNEISSDDQHEVDYSLLELFRSFC